MRRRRVGRSKCRTTGIRWSNQRRHAKVPTSKCGKQRNLEKHYLNLLKENETKMSLSRRPSSISASSGGTYESAGDDQTVYLDDPETQSHPSSVKRYDTYIKGFLILGFLVSIVVSFYTLLGSEANSPSRIYTTVLSLVFLGLYFLYSFAESRSHKNIVDFLYGLNKRKSGDDAAGLNIEDVAETLRRKMAYHMKWFGNIPKETEHLVK